MLILYLVVSEIIVGTVHIIILSIQGEDYRLVQMLQVAAMVSVIRSI